MNNYFTYFCVHTHLGVNNICTAVGLNKNRLRKFTFVGDKQLQKKECGHFEQRISSKESNATLAVVGLNHKRTVYIAFAKFSEPKKFIRLLNKVEERYIQEQQPN